MKHLKKLIALLAVAAMLLSLGSFSAFADETDRTFNFVVVNDVDTGYEYLLYQMLVGDLAVVDGNKVLSNVQWGNGVKEETKALMYEMAHLTDVNQTAANFANWLGTQEESVFHQMITQVGTNTGTSLQNPVSLEYGTYDIDGTETVGYGKSGLQGGYYLVRNTAVPEGETFSDYLVFVLLEDTAVNPKIAAAPTPEKKVTDKNKSVLTGTEVSKTGDSADYDIGDSIPFTISATLPSYYDRYMTYKLVFKDEMCEGLTFNNDAKIHFGPNDTAGTHVEMVETSGTDLYGSGSRTYTYTINDLMSDTYKDYKLQAGSMIWIEYTCTLNQYAVIGGDGNSNALSVQYSNNPIGDGLGTTTPDETTVFTYKLVFNKVNKDKKPLTGADFTLFKWIEGEGGTSGYWVDVTTMGSEDNKPTKTKSSSGTVEDSVFTFSGLDAGKYLLRETVTPAGFNSLGDVEFSVVATHDLNSSDPKLTALSATSSDYTFAMNPDLGEGSLSVNIVNESGAVLPTTGAEGTMILLLGGTVIAFFGIVILVTRRRMRAQ